MRILYGVFGYGRGHATRALGVLPDLLLRHDIVVVAGGDAKDTLERAGYPVLGIETMRYAYGKNGERCLWTSLRRNWRHVADFVGTGPTLQKVMNRARDFAPHVAICDADPWTHAAAARLGIPRISFDHFGMLAYCRPKVPGRDRLRAARDMLAYRGIVGMPERVVVSSFFDAPVRSNVCVVGPMLRDEVLAMKPTNEGFLLVYFNQGEAQLVPHVELALRALPMRVVIYGSERCGVDGNLDFRRPANGEFLRDLAACRAVFSTAGNQLVGEAMYLGKPMLVMPENTVEQRINALALTNMGIGEQVRHADVSVWAIESFLSKETAFREQMRGRVRDGRADAIAALEKFAVELATSKPKIRALLSAMRPA